HNKHHQILLLLALLEAQQKTPRSSSPIEKSKIFCILQKKNTKNNKHSEHNEKLQMIIIVRIKNTAI
ncbi:TPA: hypothetical protein ACGCF1_004728, partial [Escherichia coli]